MDAPAIEGTPDSVGEMKVSTKCRSERKLSLKQRSIRSKSNEKRIKVDFSAKTKLRRFLFRVRFIYSD